jgi:nondiscriminating glutamyl-tRNA synthetase
MSLVTRFAPSPTGYLHVGGLRTALYAYLLARKYNGVFLLRIEDTDRERFVSDGTQNILDSLVWSGVLPDAGVVLGDNGICAQYGENGPYIQSERLPLYREHVDRLIASGHAYHCFCTPERLEQVRKERQEAKLPPGYDGTCAHLDPTDVAARLSRGDRSVVRLRMPESGSVSFNDRIRGNVTFQYADVDDQVILKSDGFPTYHLAVVVDDHHMKVTHVIRGEEWISSTPKHLFLYHAFGWTPPEFAHLPLLLNPDKTKLSKRQGDVAVLDYKTAGYLPEALLNFVAFLGWNPGTEQELFTLDELVGAFSLDHIHKAGAVFNREKLDWYNREYIKKLDDDRFKELVMEFASIYRKQIEISWTSLRETMRERLVKFSEVSTLFETDLLFVVTEPLLDATQLIWKQSLQTETKENLEQTKSILEKVSELDWNTKAIESALLPFAVERGKGSVLWPLRDGLTGQKTSPDPFTCAAILGKKQTLDRIQKAIESLVY